MKGLVVMLGKFFPKLLFLTVGLAPVVAAPSVDVPLTVREEDGQARVQNPINSGVPLPRGAVKDIGELRLVDDTGAVVLASIEPRSRWLGDNSLKWVTIHFLENLPAGSVKTYRLVASNAPVPTSPLSLRERDGALEVHTGPARFVIPTDRLAPFEQVYVRNPSGGFSSDDGILRKPASVLFSGRNGESRVQDEKAEIVRVGGRFDQTPAIHSVEIEESGPGRAVVALKGTFSTEGAQSLDFTARLYFYADSALVQMTLSVRNRQLEEMARFVGIERLSVELPMRAEGRGIVASFDLDGESMQEPIQKRALVLLQSARNRFRAELPSGDSRQGSRSAGWIQLSSEKGVMTAGNRWFWQTYPKGVEIRTDGTAVLDLKPDRAERIDLYTAGAKTHFLFFHFAAPGTVEARSIAAGTQLPLVARSDPDWYCQGTKVFGELHSERIDQFEPHYQDLVKRFQNNVDDRLQRIVANRPREGWPFGVDEFGWLDFGSGLHHQSRTSSTSAESWWDSNYYDFPHAVLVNYLRTGDLINIRTAEEAGLHLADIDICHSFPGQPELAGSPRSGPVIGHFRNYTRGQLYMGHSSFTFYKNESLYELYYLTGERWYHDIGLMSSDFAMAKWGQGALRNLAHGIWGVLSAYQDTHDPKYLQRARFFVDDWGIPWQDKYAGSFKDQHWMYGLLFEAYGKYFEVTGDQRAAEYLVKALDALIEEFWVDEQGTGGLPGINAYGFGLGYQYTGQEEYFRKGLRLMEMVSRPDAEGDRVKTFAQNFRSSPYFLAYLVKGYRPQAVLLGGQKAEGTR